MKNMKMRSRLNNVRLVILPKGAEVLEPCSFLESWLPDALALAPMRTPLLLERVHRIGAKKGAGDHREF